MVFSPGLRKLNGGVASLTPTKSFPRSLIASSASVSADDTITAKIAAAAHAFFQRCIFLSISDVTLWLAADCNGNATSDGRGMRRLDLHRDGAVHSIRRRHAAVPFMTAPKLPDAKGPCTGRAADCECRDAPGLASGRPPPPLPIRS